jgi:hypothetical protein
MVFDNKVLKRIFGPKREEVTGGCREMFNEELHNISIPSSEFMNLTFYISVIKL